jgi:hypothetical protein
MSLFGDLFSLPVRLVNIPVKVVAKVVDDVTSPEGSSSSLNDYDPLCLDELADEIEEEL